MEKQTNTYEQYCWVLQRNIVWEQTVFHDGRKELRCTHAGECGKTGGCRNGALKRRLREA